MDLELIKGEAKSYGVPIIRSESQKMLADFITKYNPQHILEIGTAVGFSGIIMLSNSDADLITLEHNQEYIKQAKVNFKRQKLNKRVKIVNGDCQVTIANMVASKKYDNYFDFIFLDGPKAQYSNMLENLLFLLKPNGVFLADNVLFHGMINSTDIISKRHKTIVSRLTEFIEICKNNPKLKNFKLIEIEDGLIFAQKVSNEK